MCVKLTREQIYNGILRMICDILHLLMTVKVSMSLQKGPNRLLAPTLYHNIIREYRPRLRSGRR